MMAGPQNDTAPAPKPKTAQELINELGQGTKTAGQTLEVLGVNKSTSPQERNKACKTAIDTLENAKKDHPQDDPKFKQIAESIRKIESSNTQVTEEENQKKASQKTKADSPEKKDSKEKEPAKKSQGSGGGGDIMSALMNLVPTIDRVREIGKKGTEWRKPAVEWAGKKLGQLGGWLKEKFSGNKQQPNADQSTTSSTSQNSSTSGSSGPQAQGTSQAGVASIPTNSQPAPTNTAAATQNADPALGQQPTPASTANSTSTGANPASPSVNMAPSSNTAGTANATRFAENAAKGASLNHSASSASSAPAARDDDTPKP